MLVSRSGVVCSKVLDGQIQRVRFCKETRETVSENARENERVDYDRERESARVREN